MATAIKTRKPLIEVDQTGKIEQILRVMSRQGKTVAKALLGPIDADSTETESAIADLSSVGVLIAGDENTYYLNPNIRNFLQDNINKHNAFEALTRISGFVEKINSEYKQLIVLEKAGETAAAEQVEKTIDYSIWELIHTCERNLNIVNSQMGSNYGNVDSLQAKLQQNKFYQNQVELMLTEFRSLTELLNEINNSGSGEVRNRLRQMMNLRLNQRRVTWFKQLNDIQFTISKRRFANRLLEQRLLNLTKVTLWLAQNPMLSGIDIEVGDNMAMALLTPEPMKFKSQIDFSDNTPAVKVHLEKIMSSLPEFKDPIFTSPAAPEIRLVKRLKMRVLQEVVSPVDQMIMDLVSALRLPDAKPISVRYWQFENRIKQNIDEESWILYAATQLTMQKIDIDYHRIARDRNINNGLFDDVNALPPTPQKLAP